MGHFLWRLERRSRCLDSDVECTDSQVKSTAVAPMALLHEHIRSPHQGDRFSFFGMPFVILSAGSTA